jgi:predicted enzyme related to lactoylglutathione lyase
MELKVGNVTFDCDDVLRVAAFWSEALGRPLDAGSSHLFASIGTADSERASPAWYFMKVPEPKQAKNRVHVDFTTPDPTAVDKLVDLGATVVAEHEMPGGSHRWTVMQDLEGNEFCVAAKSFTGWA